jgi:creatinine amidohydrolase
MTTRLLLHEFTRTELGSLAPNALLVLPTGAIEQHGPHLPVGTDYFAVEHVARTAAVEAAAQIPVLVAPTMPFGSSHHHLPFGATMSLATETYYRAISDLAESLIVSGFRRIFIVNGHGGNDELIQLVARDLALKHPAHLAAASYWTTAWDALVAADAHGPGHLPGHAGAFETSLIMALRPELVQEPRPRRPDAPGGTSRDNYQPFRPELHGWWQRMNGFTDSPDRGDADRGKRYLAVASHALAQALLEFYSATQAMTRETE